MRDNNKFEVIEGEKKVFRILSDCQREQVRVVIWRLVNGHKIISDFKIDVIKKFNNQLVLSLSNLKDPNVADILSGFEKVSFYIPKKGVIFQARFVRYSIDSKLSVIIPDKISQIERRTFLRLIIDSEHLVKIKFKSTNENILGANKYFEKSCYDLSVGGLSFMVSKAENKFFNMGDYLPIKLLFDCKEITLAGEIVNYLAIEPNDVNKLAYKAYKVCIKFLNMKEEDIKIVENFVFRYVTINPDKLVS